MKIWNIFLVLMITTLFSCSSYINRLHQNIDRGMNRQDESRGQGNNFDMYRRGNLKRSHSNLLSSKNNPNMPPSTRRQYLHQNQVKRRHTAADLNDNTNSGSLWVGNGNNNHLFTNNKKRIINDIVLINVYARLKNEIASELARAFPRKINPDEQAAKNNLKNKSSPAPVKKTSHSPAAQEGEAHDRISMIVIEEINRKHLLLKGRKSLLYRKKKRSVEIQALVARKDISDNDEIDSGKIIESTITIMRQAGP